MNERDRERKKAWKLAQKRQAVEAFPLPDALLEQLFDFVTDSLSTSHCDHSLKWTLQWIENEKLGQEAILKWLRDNGGYCDCEVEANAGGHFYENRGDA